MKGILLSFPVSTAIRELAVEIERSLGDEIVLREGDFDRLDEPASAQGGFDEWIPHVTVNRRIRDQFDEHALAHELLHMRRFINGAFSLETPETVAGIQNNDAKMRKAFANDVTNQIEHVAIFPQHERFGFNPHTQRINGNSDRLISLQSHKSIVSVLSTYRGSQPRSASRVFSASLRQYSERTSMQLPRFHRKLPSVGKKYLTLSVVMA